MRFDPEFADRILGLRKVRGCRKVVKRNAFHRYAISLKNLTFILNDEELPINYKAMESYNEIDSGLRNFFSRN